MQSTIPGSDPTLTEQDGGSSSGETVLALHEETLAVDRLRKPVGSVRVEIRTERTDHLIDELLSRDDYVVERVPLGHFVDEPPAVRHEGETMVVSVLEEVVVTRLRLVEEIRLTRTQTRHRHQDVVSLRREVATVSRHPNITPSDMKE